MISGPEELSREPGNSTLVQLRVLGTKFTVFDHTLRNLVQLNTYTIDLCDPRIDLEHLLDCICRMIGAISQETVLELKRDRELAA